MKRLVQQIRCVLFFVTLTCTGCFGLFEAEPEKSLSDISFALHMSRASSAGTDFEQYRLLPSGLFVECGRIVRGKHKARQQGLLDVTVLTRQAMQARVGRILDTVTAAGVASLGPAGSNAGPLDPGKFVLTIGSGQEGQEISTSLDAVELSSDELASQLHAFAQIVRGVPHNAPCGFESFYGVVRGEL